MEEKKRLMADKIRKHQQVMAASMQEQAEERQRGVSAPLTTAKKERRKKKKRAQSSAGLGTVRKVRVPVTLENFPLRADRGLDEPLLGSDHFRPKKSKQEEDDEDGHLCEGCVIS